MVPTTALSLALLGAAIPFAASAREGSVAGRRIALGAAMVTFFLAGAALVAYASGSTLGPERLFLYDRTAAVMTNGGRMSPQTAGALVCLAWSLAFSVVERPRRHAAQALGAMTAALAVVALGGHIHGVVKLFGLTQVVGMALPTAAALLALSGAVSALHPDFGIGKLLTRSGPAGRYARHLLLASAVIPLGTAVLLRGGEAMGWYDASFRSGSYVGAMVLLLFGTAWMATQAFHAAEEQRAKLAEERAARAATEAVSRELLVLIDERTRAEQTVREREDALRRSEEDARARAAQLQAVLDCIADGVLVYDRDGRIVRATPAAARLLQLSPDVSDAPVLERVSKHYEITTEAGTRVPPEDMVAVRAAVRGETVKGVIQRVRSGGGEPRWLMISGTPLTLDGVQTGAVLSITDLTERKRAEDELAVVTRLYAVLSRVNEAIVRTRDEQSLFAAVCRIVADDGRFPLVWVGVVKGPAVSPAAWSGSASEYLRSVRVEVDGALGQGPTGRCVREDRAVLNDDFAVNPATGPWREAAGRYGLRASAAFPLHRGGQVIGALTFYAARAGAFTPAQVELLEALCADVSYALDAMEQERRRVAAEAGLRDSERRLREADQRKDEFLAMLSHELGTRSHRSGTPSTSSRTRLPGASRRSVRGASSSARRST